MGSPAELLGGEVRGRTEHRAGRGEERGGVVEHLRDAEVEQLDVLLDAGPEDEPRVRGLDVAVHDVGRVRGLEPDQHLRGDPGGARHGQERLAPEQLRQRVPREELHHDEGRLVGRRLKVEDRDHVRAAQAPRGEGLLPEARDATRIDVEQNLDGDRPSEIELSRLEDGTHSTGADRPIEPIPLSECLAKQLIESLRLHHRRGTGAW